MSDWRAQERDRERNDADRAAYRERSKMTREEKLDEVSEMVENGSLTVRMASAAERARYGIPEVPAAEEVAVLEAETSPNGGMDKLAAIRSPSQRAAAFIQRVDWGSEPVLTAVELGVLASVAERTAARCLRVKLADAGLFGELLAGRISATRADDQISARMEEKGG